jgi:hypothetical protein
MNPSGFYVDPIFSIALLLDESFLNISIKKAVPPKEIQLLYVIQVTFFNRLIINYLHDCIAYNMPTFLIYYRLFLT